MMKNWSAEVIITIRLLDTAMKVAELSKEDH